MARPALRVRIIPKFPARIQGSNGIGVTRSGGVVTVAQDWSAIQEAPEGYDAATYTALLQNAEGEFAKAPLGAGAGLSIASQAVAEAGADNLTLMSPLRTKQSIVANAILGEWLNTGTGAIQRTIDARLKETVSSQDFASLADAVVQAAGRMLFVDGGGLERHQFTTTGADRPSILIDRTTSHTGGTVGFVNSSIYGKTTVGSGVTNFEWSILGILDNYATGSGENVAIYAQGNKQSTGATWALVAEARDYTNTADPSAGLIGLEVDVFANGSDASNNRVGVDIVAGKGVTGTLPDVGFGLRIGPQNGDTTLGRFKVGAQFKGDFTTALIDATSATVTNAICLGDTQRLVFDTFKTRSLRVETGLLLYSTASGNVFQLSDGGTLNLLGNLELSNVRVLTSRRTGWTGATGTASRAGFATSTATTTELAENLKGLLDDLFTHGLLGA